MTSGGSVRWPSVGLLLARAVIHLVYGGFFVPFVAPPFYVVGALNLVGVGALATNIHPRLFQWLA